MSAPYGWNECRIDLENGVNPDTVAEWLGEPVEYLLEVAEMQGWPIRWSGQTAQQSIDAGERFL
jgi:hypothetical protein